MILCAGFGKRFRPITEKIPKQLVPIFDRPLLHYTFTKLQEAGINDIIINLHHLPDAIRKFARSNHNGMSVQYSLETDILGSAGGIKKAEKFFEHETFMVIHGDIWFGQELSAVVNFHKKNEAGLTIVVKEGSEPSLCAVRFDEGLRVRQMWGRPSVNYDAKLKPGVSTGIYVFEPYILDYATPGIPLGFTSELTPRLLVEQVPVFAFSSTSYCSDVGTPSRYLRFHRDALNGIIDLPKDVQAQISDRNLTCCPNNISNGATITPPCYFGKGTEIGPDSKVGPFTAIGANSHIGRGVYIEHSVIFPGVRVESPGKYANEIIFDDL